MKKQKTIVVALGGNAISQQFEEGNIYQQFVNTRQSLTGVADLISLGYDRGKIYSSDPKREKLGYMETGKTRDKDLVEMEKSLRGNMQIHYLPAIKEFFAFQFTDKGRMEVASGSHDDLVLAACKANFGFSNYKFANQGITVSYPSTWRG